MLGACLGVGAPVNGFTKRLNSDRTIQNPEYRITRTLNSPTTPRNLNANITRLLIARLGEDRKRRNVLDRKISGCGWLVWPFSRVVFLFFTCVYRHCICSKHRSFFHFLILLKFERQKPLYMILIFFFSNYRKQGNGKIKII